jgi:hypothetical protein
MKIISATGSWRHAPTPDRPSHREFAPAVCHVSGVSMWRCHGHQMRPGGQAATYAFGQRRPASQPVLYASGRRRR